MSHARPKDNKDSQEDIKAQGSATTPNTAAGTPAGAVAIAAAATIKNANSNHPFFKKTKDPMQRHLLPMLDSKELSAFSQFSFNASQFSRLELEQRKQKAIRKMIDLTLRGRVSDLFLMRSPVIDSRLNYRSSDEYHLYLYKEKDGRAFYYYKENQQKHYLVNEKQQPLKFESHFSFDTKDGSCNWCEDKALRKAVFDITSTRKHTSRSDSEEIQEMSNKRPWLAFAEYKPKEDKDKITTNRAGQRISIDGKSALQVAFGENHDYAITAMTGSLLAVADEKQRIENVRKIQAQYDAQYASGWEKEENERWADVLVARKKLTQAILESKPGDIQSSGSDFNLTLREASAPDFKLTLREGSTIAAAIVEFKASLQTVRNRVVTTGRYYNPDPQLKAFEEYGGSLVETGRSDRSPEMMFLWRSIGYYQSMMSLGYAHGFCGAGLYENVEKLKNGRAPRESTTVDAWDAARQRYISSAPLYSLEELGVDYAIGCLPLPAGRASRLATPSRLVSDLISIKNSSTTEHLRCNNGNHRPEPTNRPA